MTDNQIKHLEFIQNIITRMNTNSFQIKGMTVTILSALLVVYVTNQKAEFILIIMLVITLFWFLDAYYLMQERKFRGLYNDLIYKDTIQEFSMNIEPYKIGEYSFWSSFFSKTILLVYLIPQVLFTSIYIYLKYWGCNI